MSISWINKKNIFKAWFYESKVNQNISNTAAATDALRKAAAMSEKIGDESEKREHKALIGEALTEVILFFRLQQCKFYE